MTTSTVRGRSPFPGCLDCGTNTLLYTNLGLTLYSVTDYIHNNTLPPPNVWHKGCLNINLIKIRYKTPKNIVCNLERRIKSDNLHFKKSLWLASIFTSRFYLKHLWHFQPWHIIRIGIQTFNMIFKIISIYNWNMLIGCFLIDIARLI